MPPFDNRSAGIEKGQVREKFRICGRGKGNPKELLQNGGLPLACNFPRRLNGVMIDHNVGRLRGGLNDGPEMP